MRTQNGKPSLRIFSSYELRDILLLLTQRKITKDCMAVAAYTARSSASTRDKNTVCPVRKYNEH